MLALALRRRGWSTLGLGQAGGSREAAPEKQVLLRGFVRGEGTQCIWAVSPPQHSLRIAARHCVRKVQSDEHIASALGCCVGRRETEPQRTGTCMGNASEATEALGALSIFGGLRRSVLPPSPLTWHPLHSAPAAMLRIKAPPLHAKPTNAPLLHRCPRWQPPASSLC